MRFPKKRAMIMKRSIALGHCVCNPKQPCPCDVLKEKNLCPCAGERPDPPVGEIALTQHVRKAGCASKIGRADLERVLAKMPIYDDPNVLVGMAAGDDAGIYKMDGEYNLVQTVDVFSPVVDDAYTFGQICAANSVSDVYAMGGRPICALSIIGFPIEELPHEVMVEILRGGIDTMRDAGVSVVGGHSINDEELKCGFAVSGLIKGTGNATNSGARPGDKLVLSKAIGTGIISFAAQIKRASEEAVQLIGDSMKTLNKDAAELMSEHGVNACTDVTGFSLLGHLTSMANHSKVSANIDMSQVPVFAEALGCVRCEIIPGAVERNREAFSEGVTALGDEIALLSLLYDAQTSGGLLVALPPKEASAYVEEMRRRGHSATSVVGEIVERQNYAVQVTLSEPANLVGSYCEPQPAPRKPAPAKSQSCCDSPPSSSCCDSPPSSSCCDNPPLGIEEKASTAKENDMNSNANMAEAAFSDMMKAAMTPGLVDAKTKRLVGIALSISQHCEPCLKIHLQNALNEGISRGEIDEIAWVAASFTGCTGKMFYQETLQTMGLS
jgi:selenide, water dikinase